VLHLHDLNHVQVGLRRSLVNGENGINDIRCEGLGEAATQLGRKRGAGDGEEKFAVDITGEFELVEELRSSAPKQLPALAALPTLSAAFLASSKPSVITRGCKPSWM